MTVYDWLTICRALAERLEPDPEPQHEEFGIRSRGWLWVDQYRGQKDYKWPTWGPAELHKDPIAHAALIDAMWREGWGRAVYQSLSYIDRANLITVAFTGRSIGRDTEATLHIADANLTVVEREATVLAACRALGIETPILPQKEEFDA